MEKSSLLKTGRTLANKKNKGFKTDEIRSGLLGSHYYTLTGETIRIFICH